MSKRREFTASVKVAAFKRDRGLCQHCSAQLGPGNVFYDHVLADALGGEPSLDNCQCLCRTCHAIKTDLQDVPAAAKVKRQEAKHVQAVAPVAKPIRSAPFPVTKGRKAHPMPSLPPRRLFQDA